MDTETFLDIAIVMCKKTVDIFKIWCNQSFVSMHVIVHAMDDYIQVCNSPLHAHVSIFYLVSPSANGGVRSESTPLISGISCKIDRWGALMRKWLLCLQIICISMDVKAAEGCCKDQQRTKGFLLPRCWCPAWVPWNSVLCRAGWWAQVLQSHLQVQPAARLNVPPSHSRGHWQSCLPHCQLTVVFSSTHMYWGCVSYQKWCSNLTQSISVLQSFSQSGLKLTQMPLCSGFTYAHAHTFTNSSSITMLCLTLPFLDSLPLTG